MSIRWMSEIWDHGPTDATRRFILLALADNADDNGECFPSVAMISRKCCLGERMVQYHLKALESGGYLKIERGGQGRGSRSRYKLQRVWVQPTAPLEPVRVQPTAPLQGHNGVQPTAPLEKKRVQPTAPLQDGLGCNPRHLRVQSATAPLIKSLTTNEPSGFKNPPTPTAVPTDANGDATTPPVTNSIPPPPLASTVVPFPENPDGNPEVRTLANLVAVATPWATLRNLSVNAVTYSQRSAVITAAKAEAEEQGISTGAALEGLRRVVEHQVASLPPERLQFQGTIETYFKNRTYWVDPAHLQAKSNVKESRLSRNREQIDRIRQQRAAQAAGGM